MVMEKYELQKLRDLKSMNFKSFATYRLRGSRSDLDSKFRDINACVRFMPTTIQVCRSG